LSLKHFALGCIETHDQVERWGRIPSGRLRGRQAIGFPVASRVIALDVNIQRPVTVLMQWIVFAECVKEGN
jgi:hypothetical protein